MEHLSPKCILDISSVLLHRVTNPDEQHQNLSHRAVGINLACSRDGIATEIRFVFTISELELFYDALVRVASNHNLIDVTNYNKIIYYLLILILLLFSLRNK